MKNRRLAIAGLALITTLGLVGCGPAGTAGTADKADPAVEQADPAAALAAAAQKLGETSMHIDMDMAGSIKMSGVADPKAGVAQMTMDMNALGEGTKIELRKVGTDLFMKFGGSMSKAFGGDGKPWMHIDASKVPAGSNFNIDPDDPAGTKSMISAMTGVERVGDRGFKGNLDLSKAPKYSDGAKALGAKAVVPFTAATDDQGRLTEMTMDMSSLAAATGASAAPSASPALSKIVTKYSDFGTPVTVTAPPAAEVGEVPAQLKGMLKI